MPVLNPCRIVYNQATGALIPRHSSCGTPLTGYRGRPFEMLNTPGIKITAMDPGYDRENRDLIVRNAADLGIPLTMFESSIFDEVNKANKGSCYLCARMRRGHLYSKARGLGCNKIALGHHYDDVIETTLMGMLYGGQIRTMMPKLRSRNYGGMELIRPMYLIREKDICAWRDYNGLHFLRCACRASNISDDKREQCF